MVWQSRLQIIHEIMTNGTQFSNWNVHDFINKSSWFYNWQQFLSISHLFPPIDSTQLHRHVQQLWRSSFPLMATLPVTGQNFIQFQPRNRSSRAVARTNSPPPSTPKIIGSGHHSKKTWCTRYIISLDILFMFWLRTCEFGGRGTWDAFRMSCSCSQSVLNWPPLLLRPCWTGSCLIWVGNVDFLTELKK